uniref:Methionine synthase II (Cobalamin-independent) n=1 Tax=uncultured marine thaumarchaeote SAT1000_10_F12 TaxID=1456373 RepID=A0A075I9E2_9ARCH|nr:Methionine synthase II (cobalamin-independent) [uncultured marine thaumarchaeote SAT1000_10_F12]
MLKWDDIFRPFSNLKSVNLSSLNRIYEMNTFYRILSFDGLELTDSGNVVQSHLDSSLPKNKTVAIPEPFTFTELHTSKQFKEKEDFIINLAKMLRIEIDSLVESGFEVIQLLAPSIAYNKEVDFGIVSDALKIITNGLKAKTILHTYFGDVSKKIESLFGLACFRLGIRYYYNTSKFYTKTQFFRQITHSWYNQFFQYGN